MSEQLEQTPSKVPAVHLNREMLPTLSGLLALSGTDSLELRLDDEMRCIVRVMNPVSLSPGVILDLMVLNPDGTLGPF